MESLLKNLTKERHEFEAKLDYQSRALWLIDKELARLQGPRMILKCHLCGQKTTLGQLNAFKGCEVCRGKQ